MPTRDQANWWERTCVRVQTRDQLIFEVGFPVTATGKTITEIAQRGASPVLPTFFDVYCGEDCIAGIHGWKVTDTKYDPLAPLPPHQTMTPVSPGAQLTPPAGERWCPLLRSRCWGDACQAQDVCQNIMRRLRGFSEAMEVAFDVAKIVAAMTDVAVTDPREVVGRTEERAGDEPGEQMPGSGLPPARPTAPGATITPASPEELDRLRAFLKGAGMSAEAIDARVTTVETFMERTCPTCTHLGESQSMMTVNQACLTCGPKFRNWSPRKEEHHA